MRYEQFRREYTAAGLNRSMLDACPLRQFETWFEQALAAQLNDPTAMVLSTVDEGGAPWQRIVLLKGLAKGSFVFYTNYRSDKARAIEREPRVSLHFPWNVLDRQVIVAGTAQKIGRQHIRERFGDGVIPMPPFWGGYRVLPERIEFWQGGEHRLHDRFVYQRGAGRDWEIEQLQP